MSKFNLTTKRKDTGKWWSYGNMKASDRGGYSLGIRKTPEFMDLVNSVDEGGWINLSAFEEKEKPTGHQQAKQDGYQKQVDLNDEIPF